MSKKQKENSATITVNEKEYFLEDMTEKQKTIVNHCADLGRKIEQMLFNVDQLSVGKKTFDDMLIKDLSEPTEDAEVFN